MPTFLATGDLGDCLYALPIIKQLGGGIYYLVNRPDITRPMTEEKFEALKALIEIQPYIKGVEWHNGQHIDYDFTYFRRCYYRWRTLSESMWEHVTRVNGRSQGALDLQSAWLSLPEAKTHGRAVFARSGRYHSPDWKAIWPEIVKRYPGAMFIGLREEHMDFQQRFGYVEYMPTKNFLEVAHLIAGSSIFVGNQSSPNAVAEGLKHRSIVETSTKANDCIFPSRPGTHYISTKAQWKRITEGSHTILMLMLQVYPGDVYQGLELVRLITEIEPELRRDVEFTIAWRHDTNVHTVDEIVKVAKTRFEAVHSLRCRRRGVGHPSGCNDLWQGSMDNLCKLLAAGKTKSKHVLTFEPDCLPLRPDWINVLITETQRATAMGKLVLGHAQNEPRTHINGNAVFPINLMRTHPKIGEGAPRTGWDVYSGKLVLSIGVDTWAIVQHYRMKEISREQVEAIRKGGEIPSFLHGCKTLDGIKHVRSMIADGAFASRINKVS